MKLCSCFAVLLVCGLTCCLLFFDAWRSRSTDESRHYFVHRSTEMIDYLRHALSSWIWCLVPCPLVETVSLLKCVQPLDHSIIYSISSKEIIFNHLNSF